MEESREYYVYVYLDLRKPGKYVYGEYEFDYEPFYVGQGHDKRSMDHLKEARTEFKKGNQHKLNKIRKIQRETGKDPIIIKYAEELTVDEAKNEWEISMIRAIGRADKKEGPLTNMTDGGEGVVGIIVSEESRKKLSIATKKLWANPDYRNKYISMINAAVSSKENRQKISMGLKEYYKDPETRKRASITFKKYYANPENRKNMAIRVKELHNRSEYKEHMSKMMKGNRNGCYDYIIFPPEGEKFICKELRAFCEEHGLNYGIMRDIGIFHTKSPHKGYRCCNPEKEDVMVKRWKEYDTKYCIIDPLGNEYYYSSIDIGCKENELDKHSMQKIANGKLLDHCGWKMYRTKDKDKIFKKWEERKIKNRPRYILYSKYGDEYKVCNLSEFCREHNLSATSIRNVIGGKQVDYNGWKAFEIEKKDETYKKWEQLHLRKMIPKYLLIDDNGKEYKVLNLKLRAFCREYNLNVSCINDILAGRSKQHRGWKARRV